MKSIGLLYIAMLFLCGTVYAERTVWYVHSDSTLNAIQAGLDSCADNDIILLFALITTICSSSERQNERII